MKCMRVWANAIRLVVKWKCCGSPVTKYFIWFAYSSLPIFINCEIYGLMWCKASAEMVSILGVHSAELSQSSYLSCWRCHEKHTHCSARAAFVHISFIIYAHQDVSFVVFCHFLMLFAIFLTQRDLQRFQCKSNPISFCVCSTFGWVPDGTQISTAQH